MRSYVSCSGDDQGFIAGRASRDEGPSGWHEGYPEADSEDDQEERVIDHPSYTIHSFKRRPFLPQE